ncbi:MAG: hypothetical protein M2R46_01618 [Verrucomicrobia subdivision 3 bacterium]|nr:hypothetical protein [Limisphaerales bacterium]
MKVYLYGTPGMIGGAATKIRHLLRLLRHDADFTVRMSPSLMDCLKARLFCRPALFPNGGRCGAENFFQKSSKKACPPPIVG